MEKKINTLKECDSKKVMKNILITGALGSIGHVLYKTLENKKKILIFIY